jgi:hypothetical protein
MTNASVPTPRQAAHWCHSGRFRSASSDGSSSSPGAISHLTIASSNGSRSYGGVAQDWVMSSTQFVVATLCRFGPVGSTPRRATSSGFVPEGWLRQTGGLSVVAAPHYPRPVDFTPQPGAPPVDWIPAVAQQGWIVISRDRHIQHRPAEKAALLAANARHIRLDPRSALDRRGPTRDRRAAVAALREPTRAAGGTLGLFRQPHVASPRTAAVTATQK